MDKLMQLASKRQDTGVVPAVRPTGQAERNAAPMAGDCPCKGCGDCKCDCVCGECKPG